VQKFDELNYFRQFKSYKRDCHVSSYVLFQLDLATMKNDGTSNFIEDLNEMMFTDNYDAQKTLLGLYNVRSPNCTIFILWCDKNPSVRALSYI